MTETTALTQTVQDVRRLQDKTVCKVFFCIIKLRQLPQVWTLRLSVLSESFTAGLSSLLCGASRGFFLYIPVKRFFISLFLNRGCVIVV